MDHTHYQCQTCRVEYGDAMSLCENCMAEEEAEHISSHQFTSYVITRTTDKPDDLEMQQKAVWRCMECPFSEHFLIKI